MSTTYTSSDFCPRGVIQHFLLLLLLGSETRILTSDGLVVSTKFNDWILFPAWPDTPKCVGRLGGRLFRNHYGKGGGEGEKRTVSSKLWEQRLSFQSIANWLCTNAGWFIDSQGKVWH